MPKNKDSLVINDEFIEIISLILSYFKGNVVKTKSWLIYPNPNFGHIPPLKLIVLGKGDKVLRFIKNASLENAQLPNRWDMICTAHTENGNVFEAKGPKIDIGHDVSVVEDHNRFSKGAENGR